MSAAARHHAPLAILAAVLLLAAGLAALSLWRASAPDASPPAPPGKIVLTVSSGGRESRFDLRMLEALPQATLKVATPWYLRQVSFRGPLLRDVLAAAGATGTRISAAAINGYMAEIPFSDVVGHDVILATRMDGKPMSPRDKGPLFIIYPYADFAPGELDRYYARSVWQCDSLRVR